MANRPCEIGPTRYRRLSVIENSGADHRVPTALALPMLMRQ